MNDFAVSDGLGGLLELHKERLPGSDFVAANLDDDEAERELLEILPMLQAMIVVTKTSNCLSARRSKGPSSVVRQPV